MISREVITKMQKAKVQSLPGLKRGKEALRLELKAAKYFAVLKEMIAWADIFIRNLALGAMDRLGLIGSALRQKTPRLITCRIIGYGESGPAAQKRPETFLFRLKPAYVRSRAA